MDGVGLIPVIMGLFGISEILSNLEEEEFRGILTEKIKNLFPTLKDWVDSAWPIVRGTLLGFLVGSALGFGLGTAVAMSRWVDYFLYPYIVMFQSLPKIALAPLIVIWFGLGLMSKVVNAALVAFFPLLVNTMVGLRSADEDRVSLMRSLAATDRQIFWMLRLPNALPFVMAGLDIAMIFALIGAIVGEFVGATAGLGMLIQSMNFTMDVSGQFSVLLVLSFVGLGLSRAIQLVRRRVLFWDPSEKAAAAPPEEDTELGASLARDPRAAKAPKKEVTAW